MLRAGATSVRRVAVQIILDSGYIDIIKGNEGELKSAYGQNDVQQRGVDSSSSLHAAEKATLVRNLALSKRNIALMTGKTDFISNGDRTFTIDNGHEYLGMVTGTGCVLGTVISAMIAVASTDRLTAAIAGILHLEIAAEMAAVRPDVHGPGTFVPAFIDELYMIRKATAAGDLSWLQLAKLSRVDDR